MELLSSLKKRITRKYYFWINTLFVWMERRRLSQVLNSSKSKQTIYLFSNPIHSNLGDQAQTYCILNWFKSNYPSFQVVCLPQKTTSPKMLQIIRDRLTETDLLFIHSGYLMFDPHPHLPYICDVIELFKDRKIVVLPQTINLNSEKVLKKVQGAFNDHSNLYLLCRDDVSFERAHKLFPKCKLILWPDFVTSLIGIKAYSNFRNGIMFCMRNDGEKFYTDDDIYKLKDRFGGIHITPFDTTINKSAFAWRFNREKLIENVLDKFSHHQLVITDRYHGTIFSQVTSTPVIVLSSSDHKLSSGVKWFSNDSFKENVFFARSLDEAYELAKEIMLRKGEMVKNPDFFESKYFSKLKLLLDEI